MMTMHGMRKPNSMRNFFGEWPSTLPTKGKRIRSAASHYTFFLVTYIRMVQEKVDSFSPNLPQTSARGGAMMPKLNAHTKKIMRKMFVWE